MCVLFSCIDQKSYISANANTLIISSVSLTNQLYYSITPYVILKPPHISLSPLLFLYKSVATLEECCVSGHELWCVCEYFCVRLQRSEEEKEGDHFDRTVNHPRKSALGSRWQHSTGLTRTQGYSGRRTCELTQTTSLFLFKEMQKKKLKKAGSVSQRMLPSPKNKWTKPRLEVWHI